MVDPAQNFERIKKFLTELSNIWGKNFPYAWTKPERAKEIIDTWVKYLGAYPNSVLQKVLDKIIFENIESCALPEISKLCKDEDKKEAHQKHQEKSKIWIGGDIKGWCPFCNKSIMQEQVRCSCGWELSSSIMSAQCPEWLWEKHKPFIDEYRAWKLSGKIKTGYEYFLIKVGNMPLGKLLRKRWGQYNLNEKAPSKLNEIEPS